MKNIIYLSLIFSSCAENFSVQSLDIIDTIPVEWQYNFPATSGLTGDWWKTFEDTTLNKVFNEFSANSPDLKTIASRLEMAKQINIINNAPRFPSSSLGFNGNSRQQNLAAFGLSDDFFGGGENEENNNQPTSFTSKNFGLNLSMQWELDLWRRVFNQTNAAKKDFESLNYEISYLSFSLMVQLAKVYYTTVEAYQQFELANETLESINQLAQIVSARYEKGLRSSLDFRLTQSSVSSSQAILETRHQVYTGNIRRLEAMLGRYPNGSYLISPVLPTNLPKVEPLIPADILDRRPDIQSALSNLEAVSYRKAESISSFFPGVSLTSSAGTSSNELNDILNQDYQVWSQGIIVTLPLFRGRSLVANKNMQSEAVKIAEQDLVKKIITAFSEVEQSLFSENSNTILVDSYSEAAKQAEAAYKLSVERYDSGLIGLIAVLDSQQRWFQARSQLISANKAKIDTRLNLILALGGSSH
tara:strand:+ start:1336 stop:2754 length:1419 start_codon:yes stop_codon:yes gene_type:complete